MLALCAGAPTLSLDECVFFLYDDAMRNARRGFFAVKALLGGGALILCGALSCSRGAPAIISINPNIERTGNLLTIRGENFGAERGESFVRFGAVAPTLSSYQAWSDAAIVVRIPDFGESGLISVHRDGKKSNSVLFSTQENMPIFPSDAVSSAPFISAIEPARSAVGALVTVSGFNFGAGPDSGAVLFAWEGEGSSRRRSLSDDPEYVKASASDGDYESWNEHEIRVFVPDGAATGGVRLATSGGLSNEASLAVGATPGVKIVRDKKTFAVVYSVNFRVERAEKPNTLFFALPVPADGAFQRNKEVLSYSGVPFIDHYRGTRLYKFSDVADGDAGEVAVSFLVDAYAIETKAEAALIRPVEEAARRYRGVGAGAHRETKAEAAAMTGRETNPYLKARAIYRAMLKEEGGGEAQWSARFSALCRAAGIACVPVTGVLVVKNRNAQPHRWNMFWIDGLGWIPVDIALAKGLAPDGFSLNETADYYFGNVDNNRIVFSFGETVLAPMSFEGRTSSRPGEYAFQNIWEESAGALESYSSSWSAIEITGVY
ncbi:MAG: IPT/TIG domain-containing protein [Spirochaetaceae bacterium]|nr:IPT/TIG domain-containing protein [Spirochaetaceae bacterium]